MKYTEIPFPSLWETTYTDPIIGDNVVYTLVLDGGHTPYKRYPKYFKILTFCVGKVIGSPGKFDWESKYGPQQDILGNCRTVDDFDEEFKPFTSVWKTNAQVNMFGWEKHLPDPIIEVPPIPQNMVDRWNQHYTGFQMEFKRPINIDPRIFKIAPNMTNVVKQPIPANKNSRICTQCGQKNRQVQGFSSTMYWCPNCEP